MRPNVILRVLAALAALMAGGAHLYLYNHGYKGIPVGHIGAQFLLNAISSVVLAAGLLAPLLVPALPAWLNRLTLAGGVAWGGIALLAFYLARTSHGWFGFTDAPGLNPSPEALFAVYGEIGVVACCLGLLGLSLVRRTESA